MKKYEFIILIYVLRTSIFEVCCYVGRAIQICNFKTVTSTVEIKCFKMIKKRVVRAWIEYLTFSNSLLVCISSTTYSLFCLVKDPYIWMCVNTCECVQVHICMCMLVYSCSEKLYSDFVCLLYWRVCQASILYMISLVNNYNCMFHYIWVSSCTQRHIYIHNATHNDTHTCTKTHKDAQNDMHRLTYKHANDKHTQFTHNTHNTLTYTYTPNNTNPHTYKELCKSIDIDRTNKFKVWYTRK